MIKFDNGGIMIQPGDDLPDFTRAEELFLDHETTSFDPAVKAFNSWKGHRACGTAVTVDDLPNAYYVPVRHNADLYGGSNYDLEKYRQWLADVTRAPKRWINHNVKFDAHFSAADGADFGDVELVDTVVQAKLLDSDRMFRGGYGLDALSEGWLEHDIGEYEHRVRAFLDGIKLPRNKKANDYGLVPPDVLGEYACQDVLTNRALYRLIQRRLPDEVAEVAATERRLTPVLYDMEREGMCVHPTELALWEIKITEQLLRIEEALHKRLGFAVNPSASNDCYELLVNHYGLGVLAYSDDTGNASFDKDALVQYAAHPIVKQSPDMAEVVQTLQAYRKAHTLLTFFVKPYREHEVDGIMHPDYNQAVRTGRLSCKRPNAQQLSKLAKLLVHPRANEGFLSCDYSQIEFRLMVHYIRDPDATRAYIENPDTDFHQWVADMTGVKRRVAKNLNFAMGYGAGRRKILAMLMGNMELMEKASGRGDFATECRKIAEETFETYHATLPGIRTVSRTCSTRTQFRGYVFNAYGRRRHLPARASHIAFNALVQSCAADVMKDRIVALAPRYNSRTRELGVRLVASVHDETLCTGEAEVMRSPEVVRHVVQTLEDVGDRFRVPIRSGAGWSSGTWSEASGDDGVLPVSLYRPDRASTMA